MDLFVGDIEFEELFAEGGHHHGGTADEEVGGKEVGMIFL